MLETSEALIVDLFFILVVSLCTELLIDTKKIPPKYQSAFYVFAYSLALAFNMIFNVRFDGKFQMDLRIAVFVIAGLYIGHRCLIPLIFITLIYIGFIYPEELIANVVTLLISAAAIGWTSHYYRNWRLREKMIYIGGASLVTGWVIMKLIDYFFDFTTGFDSFIIGIYAAGILILIFSIEWVRNAILLKNQIQHSEKLELVSHLAASISHEIRNPLTVTRGFLQILEQEDFPPVKKREFFSLAKSELDRAEGIISDYLTFAKPISSKKEMLCLDTELHHITEVISPFANMNSVSIVTEIDKIEVKGEKQLFHQCILNIMKNGIEAMETNGGTLVLETRIQGNKVNIRITDTGIGMTEEQMGRLGEPYFSTRGKKGTGLGMMVVYSIVASMNGSIDVKSQPGKGTTFTLSFPRAVSLMAAK
jgi:two-component system sporulation sensor kinase B